MARFVEENTELPSTLRDLIAFYRAPEGRERLEHWERLAAEAASLQFVGMGTSEFTSEALAWRLTARGRLSRSCDAGELFYEEDFHAPSGGLFVLTSQSGESVEIRNLAGLERVGRHVAVTNDEASSLAKGAALVLPLCAGREDTITTKTYTNNLALFRLMEARLEGSAATSRMLDALDQVADAMETLDEEGIQGAADSLRSPTLAFVGRGEAVVSARQCGLIFMEGLKRPACSFTGGAFRHGPFEGVGPGLGLVLFRASRHTAALSDRMGEDAASNGSPVAVFDGCDLPYQGLCRRIRVPRTDLGDACGLFPLLAARAHNHLLHALATRLGIETGVFFYGHKITSTE